MTYHYARYPRSDVRCCSDARCYSDQPARPSVRAQFQELLALDVRNLAPDQQAEVAAIESALVNVLPETTTWFARGVGPVQADVTMLGIESSQKVTGCTG